MNLISIAVPTFNRFEMANEAIAQVIDDPLVGEVVFSDDRSTDGSYDRRKKHWDGHPKVRLFQNTENRDCYFNKALALARCTYPWAILFDDDNVMGPDYLRALERERPWNEDVIYCPEWAKPHFDYRAFSGVCVNKSNLPQYLNRPHFKTALNTANYLVWRRSYIEIHDPHKNPHTSDSIYMAYLWLKSGRYLKIVPGLQYFHRVHEGSHYKANHKKTGAFAGEVEQALARLR